MADLELRTSNLEPNLAAIALGSNLPSPFGEPAANLREAIARIGAHGHIRAVSSFYSTAPVGFTDQPDFLNAALLLETELEPLELLRALLAIERAMGRDRATAPPKGPRIIDLDLLLLDDVVLASARGPQGQPALTLPHPALAERRFVLQPLAEIAPAMIDPRSGRTIAELLAKLAE
ncbi:MAG: 2-amino-4-hydroxy-6-hydroxymethyldihydropteridine diphosphokinase [Acidobacteriaceae bacterium]|jgi:2-amino-4-hydroxy-6-hydroxymethyldihydropteridine diphosphokinase